MVKICQGGQNSYRVVDVVIELVGQFVLISENKWLLIMNKAEHNSNTIYQFEFDMKSLILIKHYVSMLSRGSRLISKVYVSS